MDELETIVAITGIYIGLNGVAALAMFEGMKREYTGPDILRNPPTTISLKDRLTEKLLFPGVYLVRRFYKPKNRSNQ